MEAMELTTHAVKLSADAGKMEADAVRLTTAGVKLTADAGKTEADAGEMEADAGEMEADAVLMTADGGSVEMVAGETEGDLKWLVSVFEILVLILLSFCLIFLTDGTIFHIRFSDLLTAGGSWCLPVDIATEPRWIQHRCYNDRRLANYVSCDGAGGGLLHRPSTELPAG